MQNSVDDTWWDWEDVRVRGDTHQLIHLQGNQLMMSVTGITCQNYRLRCCLVDI